MRERATLKGDGSGVESGASGPCSSISEILAHAAKESLSLREAPMASGAAQLKNENRRRHSAA
jgi:hypothetical protein